MTASSYPPPPKVRDGRFDDWLFRFWKRTDSGTSSTVANFFPDVFSVKSYGARGDDSHNDYQAIALAIAAAQANGAGSVVYLPRGIYRIGTVLSITGTPVMLIGHGDSVAAYGGLAAASGTEIKYTGGATASPVITMTDMQSGHGMRHIKVNGNSLAEIGLKCDTVTYGMYERVSISGATKKSLWLGSTEATGPACSWNEFRGFEIDIDGASAICGVHMTGDGVTNFCHNTLQQFRINHDNGSNGIDLGYCDNNRLIGIYIYRGPSGSGAGVKVKHAEATGFPVSNYFLHLQAGDGGWSQDSGSADWNIVIGYDRSNGQPAPTTNNKPYLQLDGWGTFNTLIAGTSGAAGGADIRTVVQAALGSSPNVAAINIGYQGTSANYIDANTQYFRAGDQSTSQAILNSTGLSLGSATASYKLDVSGSVRLTNASLLYWNNSSGTARPVLQLYSDNNVYADAYDGAWIFRSSTIPAQRFFIDGSGNVACGAFASGAALSTSATNGFLYIPTCAGAPSGTPTAYTGRAPIVYDSTNNRLYVYSGGWKSAAFA